VQLAFSPRAMDSGKRMQTGQPVGNTNATRHLGLNRGRERGSYQSERLAHLAARAVLAVNAWK